MKVIYVVLVCLLTFTSCAETDVYKRQELGLTKKTTRLQQDTPKSLPKIGTSCAK